MAVKLYLYILGIGRYSSSGIGKEWYRKILLIKTNVPVFVLFVPLSRKLQPSLRHHPQEEPLPPAGQPAIGPCLHPEGPAEEEKVPRRHLQDQLSGDHLHGGLAASRAGRARDPEGQPGGHTRYGMYAVAPCGTLVYWDVVQHSDSFDSTDT